MLPDPVGPGTAVFDLGGTWFRWGYFNAGTGLAYAQCEPAINYLSHPESDAAALQAELAHFVISRLQKLRSGGVPTAIEVAGVSIGAPVNAHNMTVLGSGPLWGPAAQPFDLHDRLQRAVPTIRWHVINDITALLARHIQDGAPYLKTMLITVSSGIGSRLFNHHTGRIPLDKAHGVQGEIGHLVCSFELEGRLISRRCECGGWNHLNAFASGRGIAATLRELPELTTNFSRFCDDSPERWRQASECHRLETFRAALDEGRDAASGLLDSLVTPVSRILATALTLDPEIDRIVMTGGVVHGLGEHYREALQRRFLADELYQITSADPSYLTSRLHWEPADDFSGLRGAGVYVSKAPSGGRQ